MIFNRLNLSLPLLVVRKRKIGKVIAMTVLTVLPVFMDAPAAFSVAYSESAVKTDQPAAALPCDTARRFTYSWNLQWPCAPQPRGGTTRGTAVDLDDKPSREWQALQEAGLSDFERDRRAILAMTGPYRTSFEFIETLGFAPHYKPGAPYQSWGTEYVYLVEDRGDFISLQHIMVMMFQEDGGEPAKPLVMKHWRQDWQYQKREILAYEGNDTWRRKPVPEADIKGSWAQAVYQVDDSPRYESYGKWQHTQDFSTWKSGETLRPLPRREYSVRNDYELLEGYNSHTVLPTGWVQEEENHKVHLARDGQESFSRRYLAKEQGLNRYERIKHFDFSAGDNYWSRTGTYWKMVRQEWSKLITGSQPLVLVQEVDSTPLFMALFDGADTYMAGNGNADETRAEIARTIAKYRKP
jgi:hypothetical protein